MACAVLKDINVSVRRTSDNLADCVEHGGNTSGSSEETSDWTISTWYNLRLQSCITPKRPSPFHSLH